MDDGSHIETERFVVRPKLISIGDKVHILSRLLNAALFMLQNTALIRLQSASFHLQSIILTADI